MKPWRLLGKILQEDFSVPDDVVTAALQEQQTMGKRLGEILIGQGALDEEILLKALATQRELSFRQLLTVQSTVDELLKQIPIGFAKEALFCPLERHAGRILIAVNDPGDLALQNDMTALSGETVEVCLAPKEEILRAINRSYEKQIGETEDVIDEIEGNADSLQLVGNLEPEDLLDTADEAPIIRFVNSLLTQGLKNRASDIHIEPFERFLLVRYRVDGILHEVLRPPLKAHAGIVSRIKIMAQLNIAEKRIPQDGRFRVRIAGSDIDIRVSTLPTAHGERVVMRLLDKASGTIELEGLGLTDRLLGQVYGMINKSHGVLLVTGPTGSGKTTTLYSILSHLDRCEKNIITVEDPIEYQLEGVGQIQVNSKVNLTFANGLRSILRQDPDVIMVGEIRDRETAEIVVQSALTGHMVFSTLHTNDAAGSLTRLVEMGIEPFLTASSVVGVIAQRLLRRICSHCKEAYRPLPEIVKHFDRDEIPDGAVFYRGRGCEHCMGGGYRGRIGIYELLPLDDAVRGLLMNNRDAASIRNQAIANGMVPLRQAGLNKALRGATSLDEVIRVTQEED